MIGTLTGTVSQVGPQTALIDVAGIGFEVNMPGSDLASMRQGMQIRVFTALNVSQDALTLYGFREEGSKRLFAQLQKVSGIGPRAALSVLSSFTPRQLSRTIADGDAAALTRAQGVGRKSAQKIILELSGSLDMIDDSGPEAVKAQDSGLDRVVDGLVSLGWPASDAARAVRDSCREHDIAVPLGEGDEARVLKLALGSLDRGR